MNIIHPFLLIEGSYVVFLFIYSTNLSVYNAPGPVLSIGDTAVNKMDVKPLPYVVMV